MIFHWINVEYWQQSWPNDFALSGWTLLALAWHHRSIKKLSILHHNELKEIHHRHHAEIKGLLGAVTDD